jgi:protein-disulfide isomerase
VVEEITLPGLGGRKMPRSAIDTAVSIVLVVNSLAVAYGYYQLRRISDAFLWSVSPGLAAISAARAASHDRASPGTVHLFHSFSCSGSRTSAPVIDSVRQELGDTVRWRIHYVSLGPRRDPIGYRGALLAACVGDESAYGLFTALTDATVLTMDQLDAAALAIGLTPDSMAACLRSRDARQRVWQVSLDAHTFGVMSTPTIHSNGLSLSGPFSLGPLREFVASTAETGAWHLTFP